jgi:hypothetical protein
MYKGWMLVKPQFQNSYETKRLLEEFDKNKINVKIIDPNDIDIFVNKENKQSILVVVMVEVCFYVRIKNN